MNFEKTNYSTMVSNVVVEGNISYIEELSNELGITLGEQELNKIKEKAIKLVNLFNKDLNYFKQTINEATFDDINLLEEFNSSKQVVLASSDIKHKVGMQTKDFDMKMKKIQNSEFSRNIWDILTAKSSDDKEREVLAKFMDDLKAKRDEFERSSQEITINIQNLQSEKQTLNKNVRDLAKKTIVLNLTSLFFKSILPDITEDEESQFANKLTALDRRLRSIYEILLISKKNVIDINNQIDMYNEVQNVLDEYKVSAIKIISSEVKNRIVLQDIKTMYESLDKVRTTVNTLVSDNTKLTEQLVQDVHKLSKDSIFDKDVIEDAINSSQIIRDEKFQRDSQISQTIENDNKGYLRKIFDMNQKESAWNQKKVSKHMLDV